MKGVKIYVYAFSFVFHSDLKKTRQTDIGETRRLELLYFFLVISTFVSDIIIHPTNTMN